jgi:uncharacterized protein YfaS (alpha-2-macroglobulin family)
MMTPYALYGLLQAEKAGYEISSEKAIERGLGVLRNFIGNMGQQQATDRIYCMYVYAHRKPIEKEWWTFIHDQHKAGTLSDYALALALEMAVQQKYTLLTGRLAETLRARAKRGGGQAHWTTAKFSRWGNDPHEISAVVMKALVAYNPEDELIPEIISYFASTKRGNRWNSTKDTAMILFALCEHLAATSSRPDSKPALAFRLNDGRRRHVSFEGGMTRKLVLPGTALRAGPNHIAFDRGTEGTLYRLVLRQRVQGRHLAARNDGVQVTRTFWLEGPNRRQLKPGDTVPRGAYIRCSVQGRGADGERMRYVLLASPKPSGCEILPHDDRRYRSNASYSVLREDKTTGVLTHHEEAHTAISSTCVFHAELAGEYVVPPATVEFMYDSSRSGHSGTFHFTVEDKRVDADSVRVSSR